ncbi:MAG: hypothetical protein MJ197_09155 [Bacteroidales bacterium]|nr:hypothetical protein [Bacteroidales bacterium]
MKFWWRKMVASTGSATEKMSSATEKAMPELVEGRAVGLTSSATDTTSLTIDKAMLELVEGRAK